MPGERKNKLKVCSHLLFMWARLSTTIMNTTIQVVATIPTVTITAPKTKFPNIKIKLTGNTTDLVLDHVLIKCRDIHKYTILPDAKRQKPITVEGRV